MGARTNEPQAQVPNTIDSSRIVGTARDSSRAVDDFCALDQSIGPVNTRATFGIDRFDELLDSVRERTPANRRITIDQIGRVAALASKAGAPLTGSITYADHAFHIIA